MRNLFVKSKKFAWISLALAEARTFSPFFQRALGDLHFSTLSTNNKRNQRKSWRVNFHDHHRCASRSRNETKLKRFGITATIAIGWGQEEGMDEDTAMSGNVKGKCTCKIISGSPERPKKKSYLKGYLAAIKRCFNRGQRKSVLNSIWNQILSETNRRK